jgi:hypothetical protein
MIRVVADSDPSSLKREVDADIAAFEAYFRSLPNGPLVGPERAILSTYLWWKLVKEKAAAEGGSGS